ncbi:hypothetical protein PHLCEN_2v10433 [Hermanssonia centrifuga]|uniref:Methyltransferase domain-containing protein n=1 Tax=Hermanssonia centrifuga TaxID=98765 RepID=A0A2R6NN86_9APHY|nr:hypothetical protein PHLCEN_2v10433 [Hermanssonia centrifuga]
MFTGTWLLDVINEVPPNVILHGLDIEPRLFPVEDDRVVSRGNVIFTTGTITELPQEWSNSFTLINQRLLVAALQLSQWKRAFAEMFRVLAPGGWVQIGEVGPWTAGSVTATHKSLVEALFETKGLHLDCLKFIAELLREAGFIAIYEEERSIPLGKWGGQDGIDSRDNFIGVFRGMKTPILNAGGLGFVQTEGEFDSLLDAVEQEWDETSGAEIKFSIIYATKPIPVPMASL